MLPGPLWLARPPRPGPCLDFGFQYALIRNNQIGGRILGLVWLKFAVASLGYIMAFPVVEFSREGYKIRKVFG